VSAAFLVVAAFLAGLVSFTSPCCLPLLPGYVAYVSGGPVGNSAGSPVAGNSGTGAAGSRAAGRGRVMAAAALFILGFGATFTALGATASALGGLLLGNRPGLVRAAGILVAVVGATTITGAEPRLLGLGRERRLVAVHRIPRGPAFAVPLGAAFALGSTPCVGPVLAGLLAAAAAGRTATAGAALLAVYAAGLGLPFLLLAWAVARGTGTGVLGRYHRGLARLGGGLLMAMGVAMVAGWWTRLFVPLIRWFARSGWPPI